MEFDKVKEKVGGKLAKLIRLANCIACGVAVVLLVAACGGKGGGNDAMWMLPLAENFNGAALKFWEKAITETDAAKAPGYITRGKFNLQITGPLDEKQLADLTDTIKSMKEDQPSQLVRLDLSGTTGLSRIPESAFQEVNLGSIVLPEGLTSIGSYAFNICPLFEINMIPSSVKDIGISAFQGTYLSKVIFPANFQNDHSGFTFCLSSLPSTVIFSEGREAIYLADFGDSLYMGNGPAPLTIVSPSTLKRLVYSGGFGIYPGIDTLYFYGETPPEVVTRDATILKNIKTIYVPANAIKAYEDAFFSFGNADVKALPKDKPDIASWSTFTPVDQKAILAAYKKAAAQAKK